MQTEKLFVSVIIPIFNEEKNVPQLYRELKSALNGLSTTHEIIMVNDGSADKSREILKDLSERDRTLKVLSLSRNFGQTAALVCGIHYARGEVSIFMDGDLQNDPKDIPLLIKKIEEGYDVVSGWRRHRKDALLTRRLPSLFANKIISLLSGVRLRDYGCTLKAYRTEILKDIRLYGEMHRFIPIYLSWVGAKIAEIPVNHRPRVHGRSKYNMWRSLKVILDLVTIKFLGSYSTRPIYIFGGSGMAAFFLSLISIAMLMYNKFVRGISMIQSPLLLLSALLVIIGFQSILMGLLAEMQVRTYFEASNRPIYYVREKINL
ncbi:MAG: glycosyltransferase family 2 protein [Candidatus Omnitrophica bacterium]|nr:glycosyltransferase family 2 protein [Candidatus Omnitrophota bacterium]